MTSKKPQPWQATRPNAHGYEERIDRIVDALTKRSLGIAPKRNTIAKQALNLGLETLERELGLSK